MKQSKAVTSTQYWKEMKLPIELVGINTAQMTAIRKLVQSAFNKGKKSANHRRSKDINAEAKSDTCC